MSRLALIWHLYLQSDMRMTSKVCCACKEAKSLDDFSLNKAGSHGRHSKCKLCVSAYHKDWYHRNKEKRDAQKAAYKKANRDSVLAQTRQYTERTKEAKTAYSKEYYRKNRMRILATQKAYYENNKDKVFAKTIARGRHQYSMYRNLSKALKAEIDGVYLFTQLFKGFEVDHVVPIKGAKVCGLHTPTNLKAVPVAKNRSKGNTFSDSDLSKEAVRLVNLNSLAYIEH